MSRSNAYVTITCNRCNAAEITLPAFPHYRSGDERNINKELERRGWTSSEEYEDLCPKCSEIVFPLEEE